jgi:hypothetical protein
MKVLASLWVLFMLVFLTGNAVAIEAVEETGDSVLIWMGNRSAYDVFSATDGALAGEFLQYLGEEIGTPEAALLQGFSPLGRFYIDDTWYIILINSQQELCYALVLDAAYSYGGTGVLVELDCPGLLSIIGTMDNLRGVNAESESL